MIDWLADYLSLIMFVSMFFFIFLGYPVAFIMGGLALVFALAGAWLGVFNLIGLSDIVLRMWAGVAADPVLASIPMFIFMGAILEGKSYRTRAWVELWGCLLLALPYVTLVAYFSLDFVAGSYAVGER